MSDPYGYEEITKMSIIMPGSISDHDYNELAADTGDYLRSVYGFSVDSFDHVSVPSLPEKLDELIKSGSDVIWLHGGQYDTTAYKLAESYPFTIFIVEGDIPPEKIPENVWMVDRNFPKGMYVMGRLAAEQTKTGKVGYVCGLNLQFSYGEVNAIQQAIDDSGKQIQFTPVWVGDFNDPELARIATQELLDADVDVVIGSLNSGMVGVITAIEASPKDVWFTSKYTDKSSLAPDKFLTSFLFNFNIPMDAIIQKIRNGQSSGYYQMDINNGLLIQYPILNVDQPINERIQDLIIKVRNGEIYVERDFLPVDFPSSE